MSLLLHLQHYQRCKPMILKISKSKFCFVSTTLFINNLLTAKKYKKIHVIEVLIFLKTYRYCQFQEILFNSFITSLISI